MPISIEMVPPDDDSYLDLLHEAGATSIIMNVEIWAPSLRATFCPGKCEVSVERYLDAIAYAVRLFGKGQVASVLIAGLQSKDILIEGACKLIEIGAIPTVIPFKPFDACQLSQFPTVDPSEVLAIYHTISTLLAERGLNPACQKGCTGCGGCSLENLVFTQTSEITQSQH
ncbi:MAG: hypothetical protein ACFFCW_42290 [Candidatus Hodarchaeota archaeon]